MAGVSVGLPLLMITLALAIVLSIKSFKYLNELNKNDSRHF